MRSSAAQRGFRLFVGLQALSLVSAAQTLIVLRALELFSNLTALNFRMAAGAMQRVAGQGAAVAEDYDVLVDEALTTIRKSFDQSSLASRALVTEIEDIRSRIRSLAGGGNSDQCYRRRWRVKY